MSSLALVAAVARNGVIGGDNRLLWRIKADLRHFRDLTLGKPVVMGRKTFLSIGRPLPGRDNIVVTRDGSFAADGIHVAHGLDAALKLAADFAAARGGREVMVAGGGEIYAQTIGMADRLHITEVELDPEGDARFPAIDRTVWRETQRKAHPRGPDDDAAYSFVDYTRR
ncbi:MAG: dihydrofolate reductase [Beijerinckiaceae bacterium]